jgi:hypothetical protein
MYPPPRIRVSRERQKRALVPVMSEGDINKGQTALLNATIVGLTDEPLSGDNHEHDKFANALEVRLVDRHLLPHYAEL